MAGGAPTLFVVFAVFFAVAQVFGALGPIIFTTLIGDKDHPSPGNLTIGYLVGAGIMVLGGLLTIAFGVSAEGKSLEDIATPLSARGGGTTRAEGSARPPLVVLDRLEVFVVALFLRFPVDRPGRHGPAVGAVGQLQHAFLVGL